MQIAPRELPSTRAAAKQARSKLFYPERVCRNGRVDVWLTSAGVCWCVECKKQWSARINARTDPEKRKRACAQWRAKNPALALASKRKRNARERAGEVPRREGDPGKRMHRNALRRAAVRRATPAWADLDAIKAIYAEAGRRRAAGENVHVDHEIPLQGKTVSGLHVAENLRIIPAVENLRKQNKLVGASPCCSIA